MAIEARDLAAEFIELERDFALTQVSSQASLFEGFTDEALRKFLDEAAEESESGQTTETQSVVTPPLFITKRRGGNEVLVPSPDAIASPSQKNHSRYRRKNVEGSGELQHTIHRPVIGRMIQGISSAAEKLGPVVEQNPQELEQNAPGIQVSTNIAEPAKVDNEIVAAMTEPSVHDLSWKSRVAAVNVAKGLGFVGENTAETKISEIIEYEVRDRDVVELKNDKKKDAELDDDELAKIVDEEIVKKVDVPRAKPSIKFEPSEEAEPSPLTTLEDKENKKTNKLTGNQQKRLRHHAGKMANRMAKAMEKRAENVARRLEELHSSSEDKNLNTKRIFAVDLKGHIDEIEIEYENDAVPLKINELLNIAKVKVASEIKEIKKGSRVPKKQTWRERGAAMALTAIAAVGGTHVPVPHLSAEEAARPSRRPIAAAGISQAEILSQQAGFNNSSKIEDPSTKQVGKIIYPEGIDPYTPEKFVQMPEIKGLLRFITRADIGEEGLGDQDTPPEERFGRPELIAGINTVALAYQSKHADSYLLIGDLNAPGHLSHQDGIDVDIYLPNDGLRVRKNDDPQRAATKQRAIELGKMLIDTGITDLIFYNDQEVIDAINTYAKQKGIDIGANGIMQKSEDDHNAHMHWRINKVERTDVLRPILERDNAINQHINQLALALKKEGILTPNVFAYALATMQVETAGKFLPVREGWFVDENPDNPLPPGTTGKNEARKRGYEGGENYYGRGDIQATTLSVYKWASQRLGIDFVKNPDLMLVPDNSVRVLAAYFVDRGTAALADQGKFVEARTTINGTNRDVEIANIAKGFLNDVTMHKIFDSLMKTG